MFESGVGLRGGGSRRRDPAVVVSVADAVLLAQVAESGRVENRSAARKVLAAGALWDAWIERDVELGSGMIVDCGNAAIAELAVRLGCSKTVAQSFAEIGIDLRLRLPLTRAAFEAGDLDLPRVRAISRETTGLSAESVADLEEEILSAARVLSPGPLGAEIERLILLHCPEEAAEQRKTVQAWQRGVVNRRGRGCSTVEVTVSPEEGQAVMQLVAEFTRTVCARDPRSAREKMVDAVLALMHGEPYLQCRCAREDCDAEGAGALPGRRAPLTQITMDVATLLGLASEPAYLHGHGPIDPELARELAADGTWQAMLTELVELAEELGLIDRDSTDTGSMDTEAAEDDSSKSNTVCSDTASTGRKGDAAQDPEAWTGPRAGDRPGADHADVRDAGSATHAHSVDVHSDPEDSLATGGAAQDGSATTDSATTDSSTSNRDGTPSEDASPPGTPTDSPPEAPASDTPAPPRFAVRSFLARGGRRSAGAVPAPDPVQPSPHIPQAPPTSVGTMAEAILAAVRANPALADGVFRNGHGGLLVPPPGALTYRPDAATAALVRARDRHCRFPGCARPAAQCQLDHITEYLVRNPLAGGWTIVSNMQSLCAFHHQLKTLGFWRVVPLGDPHHTGHALLWTSVLGTTAVTLPGGAIGVADLTAPQPKVAGRRGTAPDTPLEEEQDDPSPF